MPLYYGDRYRLTALRADVIEKECERHLGAPFEMGELKDAQMGPGSF
jgi:hypothetical protein